MSNSASIDVKGRQVAVFHLVGDANGRVTDQGGR